MSTTTRRRWMASVPAALAACGAGWPVRVAAQAASPAGSYRVEPPPGWQRSSGGGVETWAPPSEPAGTAQALLLAPKAAEGDFDAQFATERMALETGWGLRAPSPVAPQKGRDAAGAYAAHFASYASDAGPRYMAFLGIARQGRFAMLVFVAATDDAFARLAPQVTAAWKALQFAP